MAATVAALVVVWAGRTAAADDANARAWPVPGDGGTERPEVVRGFEPPPQPWAAGHRGVDLAAPPGTEVRAPAAGTVVFARKLADRGVVSMEVADSGTPPLRTTLEPVRAVVRVGETVAAGQLIGTVEDGPFHCSGGCLHWGLLRAGRYLDPLSLMPPELKRRPPSRLLPVFGVPAPQPVPARQPVPRPRSLRPRVPAPVATAGSVPGSADGAPLLGGTAVLVTAASRARRAVPW